MMGSAIQSNALKRLARIEGQVKGLQRMVKEGRYCIDVIQQVTAVNKALEQVGLTVMQCHIDSCVSDAIRSKDGKQKIAELMHSIQRFIK